MLSCHLYEPIITFCTCTFMPLCMAIWQHNTPCPPSTKHSPTNRFEAWKACLGVLGIPFLDVVRVLAAVLLLGNVTFIEGQGLEVDIQGGSHELKVLQNQSCLSYFVCVYVILSSYPVLFRLLTLQPQRKAISRHSTLKHPKSLKQKQKSSFAQIPLIYTNI